MMTADEQDIELDIFIPVCMASQGEEHPPPPINFKIHTQALTMNQEQMNLRSWRRKINSS